MNLNAFTIIKSIPAIGFGWAASILIEIGTFHLSDALAFTSHKFVLLIFVLLNQLYTGEKLDARLHIKENSHLKKVILLNVFIKYTLFTRYTSKSFINSS